MLMLPCFNCGELHEFMFNETPEGFVYVLDRESDIEWNGDTYTTWYPRSLFCSQPCFEENSERKEQSDYGIKKLLEHMLREMILVAAYLESVDFDREISGYLSGALSDVHSVSEALFKKVQEKLDTSTK